MDKASMILYAIMTLALVMIIAPCIIRMNQGKLLRNTAIWLAIFTFLGLIYQNFGPGSAHELFSQPPGLNMGRGTFRNVTTPAMNKPITAPGDVPNTKDDDDKPGDIKIDDSKGNGDQGYVPPKEE